MGTFSKSIFYTRLVDRTLASGVAHVENYGRGPPFGLFSEQMQWGCRERCQQLISLLHLSNVCQTQFRKILIRFYFKFVRTHTKLPKNLYNICPARYSLFRRNVLLIFPKFRLIFCKVLANFFKILLQVACYCKIILGFIKFFKFLKNFSKIRSYWRNFEYLLGQKLFSVNFNENLNKFLKSFERILRNFSNTLI